MGLLVTDAVDRDGIDDLLANGLDLDIRGAAEHPLLLPLPGLRNRQRAVHLAVPISLPRAIELDRREMSVLLAADAHVPEAAGGAARFEGEGGDALALLGRGVEAVDVVARGVVEEVGFRVRDVVA